MGKKSIGVVGLGKMGKNIALHLLELGYDVVAQNRSPEPLDDVARNGARKAKSLRDLVARLEKPRSIWVMLPAGEVTARSILELAGHCSKGDIIIDGSNSFYKESAALEARLNEKGILMLDAGCSGGPAGALSGMSITVGGDAQAFRKEEMLLRDLSVKGGLLYVGPAGSGHFVKMVHNAIEYGMMQSIGEGLELIESGPYRNIELGRLCQLWNNGSVIRGYLMELAARALEKDNHLNDIAPYVEDTGEGRWSVQTAVEFGVPFMSISDSLYERFASRSEKRFRHRVLAALRHEFGGHVVKKKN